jgi:uncharacterized RDD family membrane protein YckC
MKTLRDICIGIFTYAFLLGIFMILITLFLTLVGNPPQETNAYKNIWYVIGFLLLVPYTFLNYYYHNKK